MSYLLDFDFFGNRIISCLFLDFLSLIEKFTFFNFDCILVICGVFEIVKFRRVELVLGVYYIGLLFLKIFIEDFDL